MLTAIEQTVRAAGYVRNPNDQLFGLPGTGWYPGGPGIPKPPTGTDIRVVNDAIVITAAFTPAPPVASFGTMDGAMDWMRQNGTISEPGQPAFSNSWD